MIASRRLGFLLLATSVVAATAHAQSLITLGGGRNDNGRTATSAGLASPIGIDADAAGNVYVVDRDNNRVGRIDAVTGVYTVVAGTGASGYSGDGGPATLAMLDTPGDVALDSTGNAFIADINNNRVRRVDAISGVITTVAGGGSNIFGDGGLATNAAVFAPTGVAIDAAGSLYITQSDDELVRRVDAATKIITTIAGNGERGSSGDGGPAIAATFDSPGGIVVASNGDVYVADSNNYRVRKISAATHVITTVAGTGSFGSTGDGGPATAAKISVPTGLDLDAAGNLYIAEFLGHRIRKVDAATGTISLIAGTSAGFSGDGGAATSAQLSLPTDVAVDAAGNIYVADQHNSRVRRIDAAAKTIATIGGVDIGDGGLATAASIVIPRGVAVDAAGNVYVSDSGNHRVRKIAAGSRTISTIAAVSPNSFPVGIVVDAGGNVYFIDGTLYSVYQIAAGSSTPALFAGTGVPGLSGDGGPATAAMLAPSATSGIALDAAGNLYIADTFNDAIRKIDAVTKVITTFIETSSPLGVAVDHAGNVYFTGAFDSRVHRIDATTHEVVSMAGTAVAGFSGEGGLATLAQLAIPTGLAFDKDGNLLVADSGNNRIRRIDRTTSVITTIAGNGQAAFNGDGHLATKTSLDFPTAAVTDATGTLYIADTSANRIRMTTSVPPHRRPTRH